MNEDDDDMDDDMQQQIDGDDKTNLEAQEGEKNGETSEFTEDGMEEEFTIDDDSSSRNRNNVAINRVFKRRNSTHSQVQTDVRKELQTISASAFPVVVILNRF